MSAVPEMDGLAAGVGVVDEKAGLEFSPVALAWSLGSSFVGFVSCFVVVDGVCGG